MLNLGRRIHFHILFVVFGAVTLIEVFKGSVPPQDPYKDHYVVRLHVCSRPFFYETVKAKGINYKFIPINRNCDSL